MKFSTTSYRLPRIHRVIAAILLPLQFLVGVPTPIWASETSSDSSSAFTPPAPKKVKVNKAPRDADTFKPTLKFSSIPKDVDIRTARVFIEPLFPSNKDYDADENIALSKALTSFHNRGSIEDDSTLVNFLKAYPKSRWKAAIEYNLGVLHYQTGYLTKALEDWQDSWNLLKDKKSPELKALADYAYGSLVELNCRVGRTDELQALFAQTQDRKFIGSAAQKVQYAKDGLADMLSNPGLGYKCGPFALDTVRTANQYRHPRSNIVEGAKSTAKGTNLAQVKDWADKLKLNYQPAKRTSGSPFIIPSVMRWKVNHFAALVREKDGRYLVQDPTFAGGELWISRKALEEETDGYFLVPAGSLPQGWSVISREEAAQVWGKGGGTSRDGNHEGQSNQCPPCCGMAVPSSFLMTTDLVLSDAPVGYQVPVGPKIDLTVRYNYEEPYQPASPNFSNFGPSWVFSYLSYLTVDPSQNVTISTRGGGAEIYTFSSINDVTNVFAPNIYTQAVLKLVSTGNYERDLPDGTREIFNQPDVTGRIFLKQIFDAQGNSIILNYDSNFRLTSVQDAIGQLTTFSYISNTSGDTGFYKIQRITDPFGRYAQFQYDSTNTNLVQITDAVGMTSQFTYDGGSFIDSLVTAYGKTLFYQYIPTGSVNGRGLRITWPDGTQSISENYLGHTLNTYTWDRKQSPSYPDTTKAKTIHWLLNANTNTESEVAASNKQPFEGQVTYNYPNASSAVIAPATQTSSADIHYYTGTTNLPSSVSRTLDDGSTQNYQYSYNDFGYTTQSIDPSGRTFSYFYDANNLDLLEVRQAKGSNNDLLAKFTYNAQHRPLTHQDGSGQKTIYTYNSRGQVLTVTDPKGGVTTYNYNANGYLTSIDGPLSGTADSTSFTYDGYGRFYTVTDSEGYTLTFSYDNLDRMTAVTYPDGTYEQVTWDKLDPAFLRDRLGNWTTRRYSPFNQVLQETDPLGRTTQYTWCSCGSIASITDPAGSTTTWTHDLQGRVTRKTFADSSHIDYAFENTTSRLKSMTDALSHTTTYGYNIDNSLSMVSYNTGMASVNYSYDPNYLRLTSVSNGWGTIGYVYNNFITDPYGTATTGAGRVQKVTNSVLGGSADLTFSYDQLGRVTSRSVNGSANSTSWAYDAMSRVTTISNQLGSFGYNYLDATKGVTRLSSVNYPNGQVTNFSWFGNSKDERLQTIQNLNPASSVISQFDYTYDSKGQISSWKQQADSNPATRYDFGYDPAGQLASAVYKTDSTNGVLKQYFYNYDSASNRNSEQIDSTVTQSSFNNLNQLTSQNGGGATRVQGTINKPGTVTVNGAAAQMITSTNFVANPVLTTGTNTVTVSAKDGSGNIQTNRYSINVTGGTSGTLSYDNNGNCTNNGQGQTYEWDAENRLTAINGTSARLTGTIIGTTGSWNNYGNTRDKAFDGDLTTFFDAPDPGNGDWVGLDLGSSTTLTQIQYCPRSGWEGRMVGGKFQGSNTADFSSGVVDLYTITATPTSGILTAVTVTGNYRYVRYLAPDGGWGNIAEMQVYGGGRSEFTYDGLGRRVKIVEKNFSGSVISTKQFVWLGMQIAEERDGNNNVTKQFFAQGQRDVTGSASYFYTRDHLGSVREMTDSTGAIRARYSYDPYGRMTVVYPASGLPSPASDFGYTGHYYHAASGLCLAPYRAYDPNTARWLSRDPIAENGGVNLYGYVGNNPMSWYDQLGLTITVDPTIQAQYNQAVQSLQGTPAGDIINQLAQDPNFNVNVTESSGDWYDPDQQSIGWNPQAGLTTPYGQPGQSPATLLGHEMDHANFDRTNPDCFAKGVANKRSDDYDNEEEKRVITGSEAKTASKKGEGVRNSHRGKLYPVSGPTSNVPLP